jgi:CRISPR system Cascade subunit CasA
MNEAEVKFSYNLINHENDPHRNWIPCRMVQGNSAKLEFFGLAKLFEQASQIREIVGDSPPVTISLYRLLLAIVHRSLGPLSYHGEWQTYWRDEQRFQAGVAAYLKRPGMAERFDLFHPTHPFYQSKNTIAPREALDQDFWGKLIFQDPGSALLFEQTSAIEPPSLTPAQAVRWLIALQSFDTGGTKTAEVDKDSASPAPLLLAATGLVSGRNLFETLMLNLYWADLPFFTAYADPEKDKPAWEREAADGFILRPLDGYLDLLTWQSRRIRLHPTTDTQGRIVIKKVVIMPGYEMGTVTKLKGKQKGKKSKEKEKGYELAGKETMMAFVATSSASARRGYEPLGLRASKALWRDSFTLFHTIKEQQSKPLIFDWLNHLEAEGAIEDARMLPMDFFGMCTDQAKLQLWRHERLPLPLRYLDDEELCLELSHGLVFSEDVARILTKAVRRFLVLTLLPTSDRKTPKYFQPLLDKDEYAKAEKEQTEYEKKVQTKKPHSIDAKVEASGAELGYWPRLENEFRHLLTALATAPGGQAQQLLAATLLESETPTARQASKWLAQRMDWAEAVSKAARQSFLEAVGNCGKTARALRATVLAENWFNAEFNRRKNIYLKGKGVKQEAADTDRQTTNERSKA